MMPDDYMTYYSRMVKLLLITLLLGLDKMARAFTLNVPNVLLPLHVSNEMYTNFTLSADAGCFNWLVRYV